jgi:hypothetical protein
MPALTFREIRSADEAGVDAHGGESPLATARPAVRTTAVQARMATATDHAMSSEDVLGIVRDTAMDASGKRTALRAVLRVEVVNQHATLAAAFRRAGAAEWERADLTQLLLVISEPAAGLSARQLKSLHSLRQTAQRDLQDWVEGARWDPVAHCFSAAMKQVTARSASSAGSDTPSAAEAGDGASGADERRAELPAAPALSSSR